MTYRVVTTPLAHPVRLPEPRDGGIRPELMDACLAAEGTDALVARLSLPGVLAVTTGQQPALFTGPAYTIFKALSAAAFAAQLQQRWSRPVVPLFWVAGDDHDYAEASHAAWLGADGTVHEARLRPRAPDAPMLPLAREQYGPDVAAAVEQLAATLPLSEFRADAVAWISRHFVPGATIAASAGAALAELLAPLGVVCIDSTHPAVKRAAAPLLVRALSTAGALEDALATRAGALASDGHDAGVPVGDGATLVMIEAALGRDRLLRESDGFITRRSRERFTLAQLDAIAAAEPGRLSPNVLLRPVVESALFPTVAYAAGPGELRYLPLAEALYAPLGVARQEPVPRWSGMIVDARSDRILRKFAIDPAELLADSTLEARLVRERLPAEADLELSALRVALTAQYGSLEAMAARVDDTLVRTVEAQRERALAGVDRIENKLVAHLRRRLQTELGQLNAVRAALAPEGQPQDRVLSIVSFLARYGPAVLKTARASAESWYASALERAPVPA